MLEAVFLDSGPLGLVTQRRGIPHVDACRRWVDLLIKAGVRVMVPEVADFEIRRELLRSGKAQGIGRLDAFNTAAVDRFLPITSTAMRRAAELWADARNRGIPTADARALDADVVLAAQSLTAGFAPSDIVVASVNVRHISRYVRCERWTDITA
jgi:predicted nucleic acid-binding protein